MKIDKARFKKAIFKAVILFLIGTIVVPLLLIVSIVAFGQLRDARIDGKGYNYERTLETPFICSYALSFTGPVREEYCSFNEFINNRNIFWYKIYFLNSLILYLYSAIFLVPLIIAFLYHKKRRN